jgi:ATP-dependent RNA helicase DDX21
MIEQQAGIKFNKIGVPQPEQVIKASFRETFNQLKEVNDDVVKLFEEGADTLVEQESGNTKLALCKLLALVSGHHKQVMKARSLLSGNED